MRNFIYLSVLTVILNGAAERKPLFFKSFIFSFSSRLITFDKRTLVIKMFMMVGIQFNPCAYKNKKTKDICPWLQLVGIHQSKNVCCELYMLVFKKSNKEIKSFSLLRFNLLLAIKPSIASTLFGNNFNISFFFLPTFMKELIFVLKI